MIVSLINQHACRRVCSPKTSTDFAISTLATIIMVTGNTTPRLPGEGGLEHTLAQVGQSFPFTDLGRALEHMQTAGYLLVSRSVTWLDAYRADHPTGLQT